ncbi:MAG: YesL family protein [Lachnospiraceae bacterium]
MKRLNIDNPFFEAMGRLGDIIIINLLFVLCSLPAVTMGAALAAMYRTFHEMEEGTEGSVGKTFFRYFGSGFGRCTPVWMFMLLTGGLLVFDVIFLGYAGINGVWKAVGAGTGCLILLWVMVSAWLPVVLSEGEKSGMDSLKEAALRAVLHLPATLVMALLNNLLLICLILDVYYVMAAAPLYVVFGFGLTAFLNTKIVRRRTGTGSDAD